MITGKQSLTEILADAGGFQAILWDFDGVLMNSNEIRDLGFEKTLSRYPKEQVESLLAFHKANGGLSRYVKFRYFFNEIRNEALSDADLQAMCSEFSMIMRELLLNGSLLINDTLNFIRLNHDTTPMHVVSGSDQEELRFICMQHNLTPFFKSIHGSPTPKKELVSDVITRNGYDSQKCLLIGDSINDYEAARDNSIAFMAYNNDSLVRYNTFNRNQA